MAETEQKIQDIIGSLSAADEAAARDVLMGTVAGTDAAWDKIREATGSIRALLERVDSDSINVVTDYGADDTGTNDASSAINSAIAATSTKNSKIVIIPAGTFKITSQILMGVTGVRVLGAGYSSDATIPGTSGRTKILKDGSFDGIKITASSAELSSIDIVGETGNANDGITIENGRVILKDVSARGHGGVGIRIGKNSNNNNLWRMINVLALGNTSHGIYIHDDGGAAPDVNAGCAFGLDLRSNGGDGLLLENAIDNQFEGLHSASNTGFGINIKSGGKGHNFIFPYLESNTAGNGNIASGAEDNFVLGTRTGIDDDWTIGATSDDNVVMGRVNSLNDMYSFRGNVSFTQLHIGDDPFSLSGLWSLTKNAATRDLEITKKTTASANVRIKDDASGGSNLIIEDGDLRSVGGGIFGIDTTPDASSIVEMRSTTKGLLPPRMTTTQRDAISSPTDGLVIYNSTTNKINVRANGAWEAVTSA